MDSTSRSLLSGLRTGDENAWKRFYELYAHRIWAKVNEILLGVRLPGDWSKDSHGGHQFAADLCQDIVLKVFENLSTFDRQRNGSFRLWLDTIVRNRTLEELRKTANRSPTWSLENADEVCAQLEDPRWSFEIFTEEEHNRHLMAIALNWLRSEFPEDKVQVLLKLVNGEKKAVEVARDLNKSVPAVHLIKHRLLKQLREFMDQYLIDLLD